MRMRMGMKMRTRMRKWMRHKIRKQIIIIRMRVMNKTVDETDG